MSSIKYKGAEIDIVITYKNAMFDFKKLGINLLNIFEDESTMVAILTNDEIMLNVRYFYVKAHCESLEASIEDLLPEDLLVFRDKFWEAVVNFINPQMRPALLAFRKMILKELSSVDQKLKQASSESSPSQD